MKISLAPDRAVIHLVLGLITAVCTLLRLAGVQWGLPFLYDVDEPTFVVLAYKMLASRDANPHWFGHPGTITMYSNGVAFAAEALRALVNGEIAKLSDIGSVFWDDPSRFFLIARVVATLFGAGTIVVTYLLARLLMGRGPSLIAALLVGLAPLHVEFSQVARTDSQHTFLLVTFALLCTHVAKSGGLKNYAYAGLLLGLAISCKYPSVVGGVALITAFFVDRRSSPDPLPPIWQPIAVSALACVGGAFIGSPYMFLDFAQVWKDVVTEARPSHLAGSSAGLLPSLLDYLKILTINNFGAGAIAAVLIGCTALARNKVAAPVAALFAVYLLFISALSLHWARWILPVLPLFCIMMAASLEAAGPHLINSRFQLGIKAVPLVLLLWIAGNALNATLVDIRERRGIDNRSLAAEWIEKTLPAGTTIATERWAPQPDKQRYRVYYADSQGQLKQTDRVGRYAAVTGSLSQLADTNQLQAAGVKYFAIGNTVDLMELEPQHHADEIRRYTQLISSATLVYESVPQPGFNRGNRVRIYRLNTPS